MKEDLIRSFIKCCSCRGSLKNSKHINGVTLDKLATWKYPIWGNVLSGDRRPRAIGFVCDQCIQVKAPVKYAVEWDPYFHGPIKYHPVSELKDLPEIKLELKVGKRDWYKDSHKNMTNRLERR